MATISLKSSPSKFINNYNIILFKGVETRKIPFHIEYIQKCDLSFVCIYTSEHTYTYIHTKELHASLDCLLLFLFSLNSHKFIFRD